MTLSGRGLHDAAWEVLKRAERVAQNANLSSGYLYWGLAATADERHDAQNAVRYINLALKLDPAAPPFIDSHRIIRERVISTFKEMDATDAAIPTVFRLIAHLDAVDARVLVKYSRHVAAEGNHEAALGLAQDAVDREPRNAEAYDTSRVCLPALVATRKRATGASRPMPSPRSSPARRHGREERGARQAHGGVTQSGLAVSRRIRIADFAWKRVAFCVPRFVNPLDEPVVGSLVTQVVLARPARIVLGDSGCEVLMLRSILKMMQVRAVHPLLSVTAVVASALGQNPDLATLVAAARVPTTNNGHFEVLQLSLDPGRAESYVTRDMVKLGRVG
jgi:tetratricopeptide (TPR) repeat protein